MSSLRAGAYIDNKTSQRLCFFIFQVVKQLKLENDMDTPVIHAETTKATENN